MAPPRIPLEVRFWSKVAKTATCWLWVGGGEPYGRIHVGYRAEGNYRLESAHVVSWVLAYGPVPESLYVLHTCDVKLCVRPDHLFVGTALDNMQDKMKKGRHVSSPGERNGQAKLSDAQVFELRALYVSGTHTQLALSCLFGVSNQHVSRLVSEKRRKVA